MKFIAYVPGGYPDIDKSMKIAETYIESGCLSLEISFPPSDPIGESEEIAKMMNAAYKSSNNYKEYMEAIINLKSNNRDVEIYLLMHREVINKIGFSDLLKFCRIIGVSTIICPDIENEIGEFLPLREQGIKFATPLFFEMTDSQIVKTKKAEAFIYAQAFPLPGQKIREGFETLELIIKHLRDIGINNEIYAGVGIRNLEKIEIVKKSGADGFFMGSYLLQHFDDLTKLKEKTKEVIIVGKK